MQSRSKPYHLHGIRVILFCVALIALCLVRIDARLFAPIQGNGNVLAFATNVSIGDLHADTNAARVQNGLGALALHGALNSSAQTKAQDMINHNYWSHVSPNGTQPWWFFTNAGYQYSNAGENLAYGFADSSSTVNAWMNSPAHRANMLGSYTDVGFGIASSENYQGGQNTVVVAHYATPVAPPPPAPAQTAPAQTQAPTPPTETPAPAPAIPVPETPAENMDKKTEKTTPAPPVKTADEQKTVPLWQVVIAGRIPLITSISILLLVGVAVGYGLTHRALFKHALLASENYALHHPILDVSILAVISLLVLLSTAGRIG